MIKRHAGGNNGFTLVELLVSITVLAVALLAVATMQGVAVSSGSVSQKIMVATELANEAMEDITAWDVSDPRLNSSATGLSYASNVQVTGGGTFNITYSTSTNTPVFGSTRIEVTVRDADALRGVAPIVITGYRRTI